mgnify:CR=1 FL=1
MADPDPTIPQVVDPERTVDLTRLLQIRGPLGVLNVLDTIVPVVNMGDVVPRSIRIQQPSFRTTDIFGGRFFSGVAADTILADTGALAEGDYDLIISMTSRSSAALQHFNVEIRNAANTVNLAVWSHSMRMVTADSIFLTLTLALVLATDERVRVLQRVANVAGEASAVVIFARRRA